MATKVFQYVKGNAVPNAQSYDLYKKTDTGYKIVAGQQILHQLEIVGSIGSGGFPDEMEHMTEGVAGAQYDTYRPLTSVTPIRDLTTEGHKYYIRFSGSMNIDTYYGVSRGVPFQGDCRMWFNSPDEITDLEIQGLRHGEDNALYLMTNKTDAYGNANGIKVFNDVGDQFISAGIVGEELLVYGADSRYRRTDPILIDDLTNNLLASTDPLQYACVGPFQNDNAAVDKILFYDNLSFSSFRKGLRFSSFNTSYVTIEKLKELRDTHASGAKYVVFCSKPGASGQGVQDFVSLGGIYFMLTGNEDVNNGDVLVVQAIGDKVFFDDSPYSNEATYNKIDS